jgi:cytochrome b561/polyisoprenoid-binding protein YceI
MKRYSSIAIGLHWLTATAIVVQLALAWRMETSAGQAKFDLIQLHKSVGFTILALTVLRLAWRATHRAPPYPAAMAVWEKWLAAATHWLFYGLLIALPLSGWISVSTSPLHIPTLLYGQIPLPHLPVPAGLYKPAGGAHMVLAFSLIGLLLLHVAGAVKHQVVKGDERVLPRMAPGLTLWMVGSLVALVAALGLTLVPPHAPPPKQEAAPDKPGLAGPALPGANWTVAASSQLTFDTAWAGTPIKGRFARWNAAIAFDDAHPEQGRMKVVIDLASVSTGDAQRDAALTSPDWFNTTAQPVAVFEADNFERRAAPNYVAHGRLTLAGQTRPLDVAFTMAPTGLTRNVQGQAVLNRHDFGIGKGQPDSQLPAQVTVRFDLVATKPAVTVR